jgi:flagellar biosynthesis/type III secretory pathway protein FliH
MSAPPFPAGTELRPTVIRAVRPTTIEASVSARPTVLPRNIAPLVRQQPAPEPATAAAPRSIAQPSPGDVLRLDPALAAHVDQLIADAAANAYQRGLDEGRTHSAQQVAALEASISAGLGELRHLVVQHREHFGADVVDLAEAIATVVIDRTPHDGGRALLDRVADELDAITNGTAVVAVHPDDLATVAATVNDDDVSVVMDPRLQPGEVKIHTEWSTIERTRDAAWEIIRQTLTAPDDSPTAGPATT